MGDNNVPAFKANTYYNWDNSDPDAIVILNRGTEYEFDLTNDVISFNTSNSIDSSTGTFTLTLDNKNDHLVNRFNYSRVKKMSSIEIFSKPLNSFGTRTNSATSTSVQIPALIDGKPPTLKSMFEQVYGKDLSPDALNDLKQQFYILNANRVAPVRTGQIDIQSLKRKGIKVSVVPAGQTTRCQIEFSATTQAGALLAAKAKPIIITADDNIISNDEFYLRFTMNAVTIETTVQNDISVNQSQQKVTLPQDWDGSLADDKIRSAPLRFAMPSGMYERIFHGVIVNVSVQTSPGSGITVVLNGEGIGYWLKISYINTKPGGFESQFSGQDLTAFSTRFTQLKALDVFRRLISASTDIPTVANFNVGTATTSAEYLISVGNDSRNMQGSTGDTLKKIDSQGKKIESEPVKLEGNLPTQKLNDLILKRDKIWEGVGITFSSSTQTIVRTEQESKAVNPGAGRAYGNANWISLSSQYREKQAQVENNAIARRNIAAKKKLYIDNSAGIPTDIKKADIEKFDKAINSKTSSSDKLVAEQTKLKLAMSKEPMIAEQLASIETTRNSLQAEVSQDLSEGRKSFLKQVGIMDHWKKIFSNLVLEVLDNDVFLEHVYPYKYIMSNPSAGLEGDYVNKETIARQIAEFLQYEFYFDTNGHFVLKPPFYNMSYDQSNLMYTIEDDQVVNFSCNDTIDGLINRISVTGDFRAAPGAEPLITQNIFQDLRLIRDFGFHAKQIGELHYLHSAADCRDFGISMMSRNNMKLFNASVTIQGRPGIRLGTPVYFKPRDTVYYIKDISHEFTVGGQYTTTLGLIAGRRMVTGFKSSKKIRKFTLTPIHTTYGKNKGKVVQETAITAVGENDEIGHYILSDGFNTESEAEYRSASGIKDSEQRIDQDESALIGLNAGQTNKVFILRNKYIIVDHYNPAFIGLIIDENSAAISGINLANYEYFFDLNPSKVPNNSVFGNLNKDQEREKVTDYIKEKFKAFTKNYNITPLNAGRTFTIDVRRNFITFFLAAAANEIANKSYDEFGQEVPTPAGTEQISNEQKATIGQAANIFNLLISSIDRNGLYKQFTDAAGREVPGYQDYGLTLIYENNQAKISGILRTDEVVNSNNQKERGDAANRAQTIKNKAQNLSGAFRPSGDEFKSLIQRKFSAFSKDVPEPSQEPTRSSPTSKVRNDTTVNGNSYVPPGPIKIDPVKIIP